MRLGGPVFTECTDPAVWIRAVQELGYRAAYCPLPPEADLDTVHAFASAASKADIVISEVGAWSNPISPDPATQTAALALCKKNLDLADRIGARCCVNISGSRGEQWDGPAAENFTADTFERIVETVREIIDSVRPARSFYTLEMMPWMYPDSPECYLRLLRAVDRKAFGVHLDPVNILCSPQNYFRNRELLRECFSTLGPHIRSCHAKDILLTGELTVHLLEVRPGLGGLDYSTYLRELAASAPDVPLMLEHLPDEMEYRLAAEYIRSVARNEKLVI